MARQAIDVASYAKLSSRPLASKMVRVHAVVVKTVLQERACDIGDDVDTGATRDFDLWKLEIVCKRIGA
jgi:hypothetical protein